MPKLAKKTAKVTSFSAEFLEKMRIELLQEKERLENELAKLNGKGAAEDTAFPNYGDSEDENAAEVADYIVNLSVGSNLEKSLRDVNLALSRLDEGAYGTCKYCGKSIEQKRLEARPTSSSCMTCKKAITQEA